MLVLATILARNSDGSATIFFSQKEIPMWSDDAIACFLLDEDDNMACLTEIVGDPDWVETHWHWHINVQLRRVGR